MRLAFRAEGLGASLHLAAVPAGHVAENEKRLHRMQGEAERAKCGRVCVCVCDGRWWWGCAGCGSALLRLVIEKLEAGTQYKYLVVQVPPSHSVERQG